MSSGIDVLERAEAVRDAARRWRAAGAIDERTEARILAEYPDPRFRPTWVWRVLTFVFVTAIVQGIYLALTASGARSGTSLGLLSLFVGVACVVASELQEGSPRLSERGGAGATAFWAGFLVTVGGASFVATKSGSDVDAVVTAALLLSTLVWAAASWRWRSPVFVLLSGCSFFGLLARLPSARLLWLLGSVLLTAAGRRGMDEARLPPSRRRGAAALLVVGLAALYGAANCWSLEGGWIEAMRAGSVRPGPPPAALFVLAGLATALLPAGVLVWGVRVKRTLLIDAGIVLAGLSLVTLRHYVHIAALWAVLGGAGAVLLAVSLALDRWLSRGPGRERGGFTCEPLFSDEARARLLQVVPVAATLGPAAPPPQEKGFTPGGGSYGGGGASERF